MDQVSGVEMDAGIAAKLICCNGFIQLADAINHAMTAALATVGDWLTGDGHLYLGGTVITGLIYRNWKSGRQPSGCGAVLVRSGSALFIPGNS